MSETLPRWNLPEVNFLETDADTIKTAIIQDLENALGRTLADGDPLRLVALTFANAIILLRNKINTAAQQNILSYAVENYLDALGRYFGVTRIAATAAITTMEFTLSEAVNSPYVIAKGFQVSTGDVIFATDEELIIPAGEKMGQVTATCTETGTVGNGFLAGQVSSIVTPQTFLESAVNLTETSGGDAEEDDESYAERIRKATDSYSVAGPRKSYVAHAEEFSALIADCEVVSPVPGEVDVYVILENGELPSETFLQELLEHLSADSIRPLTDYVVCKAPTPVEYEINVDYWISSEDSDNATTIKAAIEEAVENYKTWQSARIGRDIRFDKLIQYVMEAGACDIDNATLKPSVDIELDATEIAQCVSTTVTFQGYKDI